MSAIKLPINYCPRVQSALEAGKPIVALESTVITHGLPYPQNWALLARMEELIQNYGATPATIMIWRGTAHIGIGAKLKQEIEAALSTADSPILKLGSRELPLALARGDSGGTTVSATLQLAHEAGIRVFATGGIGGVHRGWQHTLDISMDLAALSRYPVILVSAGCKAILDVPATLEQLESLGVPVVGWQTDSFPLFYTASSPYPIDRVDTLQELVTAWHLQQSFPPPHSGMLVANPIPQKQEIPASQMEPFITAGILQAEALGIKGKNLTPFLLDYLASATKNASVVANLALLENNAILAARIATAL